MTIQDAIKDLNFQSEGDSGWKYTIHVRTPDNDCANIKRLLCKPPLSTCTELNYKQEFRHWIENQPDKLRYFDLFNALNETLYQIKVFRLSSSFPNYNIQYCIAGKTVLGVVVTLIAEAVET
jgi:hypothetical protein